MTLNFDTKKFKTVKRVYDYIAATYPEEVETKALEFMAAQYADARPSIYNKKLQALFAERPDLLQKHTKPAGKKNAKNLGGKVLNNIKEVCALILKEAKESGDYSKVPETAANIFDDDSAGQFSNKLAHIRYKKKLMQFLRKEDIPEDIKKQLKLNVSDSKEYAKYQNDRQQQYMAKKKAAEAKEQPQEASQD